MFAGMGMQSYDIMVWARVGHSNSYPQVMIANVTMYGFVIFVLQTNVKCMLFAFGLALATNKLTTTGSQLIC